MELTPTIALMKKVYKITSEIINRVKKLRKQGSRQMKMYLQKEREIQLSLSDIKGPQETVLGTELKKTIEEKGKLEKENKLLVKQKATLKRQVTHLAVQMQMAQSSGYRSTRGRSKNKTQYSQRWLCELK